jgi:hypothetical protein
LRNKFNFYNIWVFLIQDKNSDVYQIKYI